MSRFSRCAALAFLTAAIASSAAYAAREHHDAAVAGAHKGRSEEDTHKQCLEEAHVMWPSGSWEMQANRRSAEQSCMFDNGLQ